MWMILVGGALVLGSSAALVYVFWPDTVRAYFYRSRHCPRAAARRVQREAVQHTEEWFHDWRKQYPALMEETREMRVLSDR